MRFIKNMVLGLFYLLVFSVLINSCIEPPPIPLKKLYQSVTRLWQPTKIRQPSATAQFVFNGNSKDLKATKIIASLDEPMPKGVNVIWSASFLSAWKSMQSDFLKEPIALKKAPVAVAFLNNAIDPRTFIPANSLYAITGIVKNNIEEQIKNELKQKFPHKIPPVFPAKENPKTVISYAYLEAGINFTLPFFQNRKPLLFTNSQEKETSINSFGLREEDEMDFDELREQVKILFETSSYEFAIDLDRNSQPNQIILALIEPKETLAKTIMSVENKISASSQTPFEFSPVSKLLVPDIVFNITHHFSELEGLSYSNTKIRDYQLTTAQQDILFRLDRNGAELKVEAVLRSPPAAIVTDFIFNRPFLLYMKKRGETMPYFAMWVDNAELLGKWKN